MLKPALIIASVLSVLVVASFLGYSSYEQKQQFAKVRAELEQLKSAAEMNAFQATVLKEQLTNSHARIEALLKEKEEVTSAQKKMEQQMRSALESKDVTISELQGKLTVNILDRILFASGEAELKPEGEKVLMQIAEVLSQYPDRQIFVTGHTDNVPIRASVFSRYPSNWELSSARANAAVRFLAEKAGVDPKRLASVGYGEFHPIADNSTSEGRARNRRIAIVVMPEQLRPLETLETKNAETNAPASSTIGTNAPAAPSGTNSLPQTNNPPAATPSPVSDSPSTTKP